MKPRMRTHPPPQRGFTLLELLVVIGVIGLIAAIAIPQYNKFTTRTKVSAAAKELLDLRTSFYAYLIDNEDLPPDVGGGVVPNGMASYVPSTIFSNPTPLGGRYNWDGLPSHNPPGISIENPTVSVESLQQLDRFLDDGDFSTGQFVTTNDGHYKLIIEPQ